MKQKYIVTGMTCSACSSRVERFVNKLEGVNSLNVNLLTNSMQVDYDETVLSSEHIIATVVKAGYGAEEEKTKAEPTIAKESKKEDLVFKQIKDMKTRLLVSFLFMIPLMYISMGHMWGAPLPSFLTGHSNAVAFAFTQFLLCLPVLYVNRKYFSKGYSNLFAGAPSMDSLIAIGSSASLLYGIFAIYRISYGVGIQNWELVERYHSDLYFESSVMILTLITLGKFLEAKSKGKTGEAISKLMDLAPKTAIVEQDGNQIELPVEKVKVGDIVYVKMGASVPIDGVVIEGTASIDESGITGESIPVQKEVGANVVAATINKNGFIKVRATKVGKDTAFSQIIRLVEEASSTKAPIAKLADKIAGIFVPIVMLIALIAGVIWLIAGAGFEFALSIAICVLVISCPCALGLATPVAIMVGTGKGAENGILIKSGEALELAHSIDCVVLDKTGTITEGKPRVTDIIAFGVEENRLLQIAGGLEARSEHPLAEAILSYTSEKEIELVEVSDFTAISGKGLRGHIDNDEYLAGNTRLFEENSIMLDKYSQQIDLLAEQGKTPMLFAKNKAVIGIIAVADTVKATSAKAIGMLREMGIEVTMLTGDNKRTAEGIGRELMLDKIVSEVLPQDKDNVIAAMQAENKIVAMVGDGVNDAIALARANVGIAIGAGTDVAVESADIILMRNDLLDVVTAIRLSKAVLRNIKQNLFWAFFYNSLGIPLAAGLLYPALGWKLNPMFAAAAMSFSSIFVVFNALRLRFFHKVDSAAINK